MRSRHVAQSSSTQLKVPDIGQGDNNMERLADSLQLCGRLKILEINSSELSTQSAPTLARRAVSLPTLKELTVDSIRRDVSMALRDTSREVRRVWRDTRLTIRVKVWGRGSFGSKSQPLRRLPGCRTQRGLSLVPGRTGKACTTHAFLLDHSTRCTVFRRSSCLR